MRLPLLAACLLLPAAAPFASATLNPITVRVEQQNKTQTDGPKTTQSKGLKVLLSNGTKQEYAGLRIKYFLFARDMTTKDVSLHDQGEKAVDLKGLNSAVVETPDVTAVSVAEHSKKGGGGSSTSTGSGSSNSKGKKVEASGQKMIGYGVQIFDSAGKLVGEAYEPLSMKEQVAKVPGTPAAKR